MKIKISGLMGGGKTTFAHWLAIKLREAGHRVTLKDGGSRIKPDANVAMRLSPMPSRGFNISTSHEVE